MIALPWTALSLLGLLAAMLVTAAVTDLRSRNIPNLLTLGIAALAGPWWLATGLDVHGVVWQIAAALILFALFAACFAAGVMGGGDVKLIGALALWLPLGALADLLVWMALGGGVLTIAMMVRHRVSRHVGPIEVPYGVAIAGAALLVLTNDILTKTVA